jgi:integrase/recombinase XerD
MKTHLHMRFYLFERKKPNVTSKNTHPAELDQVLHYISTQSYSLRNRVMLLTGFWSGMRVGEIASLKISDVDERRWHCQSRSAIDRRANQRGDSAQYSCPKSCVKNFNTTSNIATSQPCISLVHNRRQTSFHSQRDGAALLLAFQKGWYFRRQQSHHQAQASLPISPAKGIESQCAGQPCRAPLNCRDPKYIDVNDDMKRNAVELV